MPIFKKYKQSFLIGLVLIGLLLNPAISIAKSPKAPKSQSIAYIKCDRGKFDKPLLIRLISETLWNVGYSLVYESQHVIHFKMGNSNFFGIKNEVIFNIFETDKQFLISAMSQCSNGSSNITGLSNSPDCDNTEANMDFLRKIEFAIQAQNFSVPATQSQPAGTQ